MIILDFWLFGCLVLCIYTCAFSCTLVFNQLLTITRIPKSLSYEDTEVLAFVKLRIVEHWSLTILRDIGREKEWLPPSGSLRKFIHYPGFWRITVPIGIIKALEESQGRNTVFPQII